MSDHFEIVAMPHRYAEASEPSRQLLGNFTIRIDGDTAQSSCYVQGFHVGAARPDLTYEMDEAYHDRLVQTEQRWRIAHRRLEVLFERVSTKCSHDSPPQK